MKLTALVDSPDHVCCRYRLSAFAGHFARAGHTLEVRALSSRRRWWDRLSLGRDLADSDAVILQRKLLPSWQIALLRRRVRRLVFDFDDAVWMRDSYSPKGFASVSRMSRFRSVVRRADAVIAGNGFLADAARRFTSAGRVRVVPTCVDPARYPSGDRPRSEPGVLRLVWVGSSSTLQGLERMRPILERLGAEIPGLRLKVICDRFPEFERLPVERCPWDGATEAAELAAADVGIAWVPDDPWSRGKCGLKVLQYMAAGLPVVANPVGVQAEMVVPGMTGFLAGSPNDWVSAVRALAFDPAARTRMGRTGRDRLEREYSIAAGAARWAEVIADHLTDPQQRRAG